MQTSRDTVPAVVAEGEGKTDPEVLLMKGKKTQFIKKWTLELWTRTDWFTKF